MKKFKVVLLSALVCSAFLNCSSSKNTAANDGSSVEKAIKVKSVAEEYEVVRKLCPDCKSEGQALISKGSKHFDVLIMIRPGGEKIRYYFDINSFYGKW